VPPVDISVLAQKGSVFLAKPTLATFVQNRADIEELSNGLFDAMAKGIVTPVISERFALDDVARAHDKLESRATTGSIVLVP
ncbi:MAG: zinc-binding dehydrogenase, partial [Burkholderiaceae bacterium]